MATREPQSAIGPADFRSDTVTTPTPEMYAAMVAAPLGDDVLGDEPTVMELQETAAAMLGHEAAVFVPSGTMANLIGISLHAGRGDEVLLEEWSHPFNFEGGGLAAIVGAMPRTLPSDRGKIDPARVRASIRPDDPHFTRTKLLCIENTHNMHGGSVVPLAHCQALREAATEAGLKVHLDGARLFNAAVAANVPAREFAALADTVSICLSKGLGAPVGSVLLLPKSQVKPAIRMRKMLGGGMRQAGVIAAAGLVALRDGPAKLADDHRRARELANGFLSAGENLGFTAGSDGDMEVPTPETNMVFVRFPRHPEWHAQIVGALGAKAIRALAPAGRGIRFVLHHQITDEMVARAVTAFADALAACKNSKT